MEYKIKLDQEEAKMLMEIIYHAIHGLGLGVSDSDHDSNGRVNFENNKYFKITEILPGLIKNDYLEVGSFQLNEICIAYNDACEALDSFEIETITGYTWEQAQELLAKLRSHIKQS